MRFAFTEEQLAFAAAVRDLLDQTCSADALRAAWEGPTAHDDARWRHLGEMGVLGLTVPEQFGGLGLGSVDLVAVLEETGRAALPEPLVEHAGVAGPLLADVAGSDAPGAALARAALAGLVAGESVVGVQSQGKPHVLAADVATDVVLARRDELHLVPRDALTLVAQTSVDRSRRLFEVDWRPSPSTLLVGGEEGFGAINRSFDRGALGTAAQLVGLADRMVEMTVDYVGARRQFGVPVGSFQAVKHHLADALLRVEFARPPLHRAAWSMDCDHPDRSRDVSMAKAMASDAALLAAKVALQCHGAIGYTVEYDLHLFMKRAWALAAQWGDATWHRRRVALAVMGGDSAAFTVEDAVGLLGETLG